MSAPELERYTIIGELGQGGMSVVYRARDVQLSRDVAVKVLHAFLAKQPDARRRFHREAVAVAKLHHPGILEIFDYSGPNAEQAYIVTELIEGRTLRKFVEDRGTPQFPELGVLVLAELTRALRHAHEQGVVHRDLKPENIMITTSGQLKLMDFGIAQIMGGATKLTATGTLLGSPAHMAPEVIDGKASDHRCDIFSLGTILYWLTTGVLPFEAPNPSALFRRILEGNYDPPQMIQPKIGNGLAHIIEKALAQDPEHRYQDVSLLESDLLEEMREVGLEPTGHLAKQYLLEPKSFADEFAPKLIDLLASSGEAALEDGNVGRAMDRFNRVLAIDPHHEKVKALSARIGKKERLVRRAKQAAVALVIGLVVGGAGYGAYSMVDEEPARYAEVKNAITPVKKVEPPPPPIAPPPPPPPVVAMVEPPAKVVAKVAAKKPLARRVAEPPPPPMPAVMADPKIAPPPLPKEGALPVKIGSGYADIHCGDKVISNQYSYVCTLPPGRHLVFAEKPKGTAGVSGRYAPREVEVDEDGAIFLIEGGQRVRKLVDLRFRVARTKKEIDENPEDFEGWTSY